MVNHILVNNNGLIECYKIASILDLLLFHVLVALFDISISNIDCQYMDTFENIDMAIFENIDIDIDIDMAILENIDIDIDKRILQNIDKISYRQGFGISNTPRCKGVRV